MMELIVTLGQDTPAYADVTVEVPDGASEETVIAAAKDAADQAGSHVFTPSYDWSGLRVVEVTGPDGECLAADIAIEPSGEDLGGAASSVLRGSTPFAALIDEAERLGFAVHSEISAALTVVDATLEEKSRYGKIPEFKPFDLVVEAFACDEYGDSPRTATIPINNDFVDRVIELAAIGKANKLTSIHDDAHVSDSYWDDENDDLRMRGTSLVMMPIYDADFYLRGHPKHADYSCETRIVAVKSLVDAAVKGPGCYLGSCFMWKDGRLFYAADSSYLQDMVEDYTSGGAEDGEQPTETDGDLVPPSGYWVIYHSMEKSGARFWSEQTGWSSLDGATRYESMPTAPYPLGGPENTQAGALHIGAMKPFTVTLQDSEEGVGWSVRFECFAENAEHAIEQAINAYPGSRGVLSVVLTEDADDEEVEHA
ncbi:MAG: hypothetical protein ACP5RC_10435 [Halothiobacillaceae bacterium]